VTESRRSALMPDVPTATEQGVAGVEVNAWYGMFAPAATPAAVLSRINQEVNQVLKLADVREKFLNAGLEPLGGDAQVLAGFMRSDDQRYGAIARALNITVN
jgi:tripartite-type tricarboxylate transporter receptor subunit TctC